MSISKMNLRRYHHSVYFPDDIGDKLHEFVSQFRSNESSKDPDPTHHAAEQLLEDRKALKYNEVIPLPTFEELFNSTNTLVEAYENLDAANLQKIVIRVHNLHEELDFTYVVAREGFIVSSWANEKNDVHRLTHDNKYYNPK